MDKIWLKSYPPGVPAEIDTTQYRSLVHLLEEAFKKHAERDAYACMDRRLTFAEVDTLSSHLGAWLQSLGLSPGARVALMMPNVLQYPVAIAAVLRAGYVVVNVNPLYTPRELEHQLRDSGAEVIVVLENFAATLEKVLEKTHGPEPASAEENKPGRAVGQERGQNPVLRAIHESAQEKPQGELRLRHIVVASMGDLMGALKGAVVNLVVRHVKKLVPAFSLPEAVAFRKALADGAGMALQPVSLGHDDIAFLQYTGGTTGLAKGATLTHRNLIANVLQSEAWLQPALQRPPQVGQMTVVCALPLYHIFALTVCGLMSTRIGAMNLLIPNPRDFPGFIKELGKYKVNMLPAVNTLFNALLNQPDFARLDFSSYKVCIGGGMAVQRAVNDRWTAVTGVPITEGYGLSETSPIATCTPAHVIEFSGTIGLPVPSTDIMIVDDAGQEVALGQAGEIAIRGPQVMAGYWNNPDETARSMTADGFFKSGDIGIMDERGYTRIVDRKKDMILVSGFNVYPNEIESVVGSHPGVLECACVGVPDADAGEAVKVFVVRRDPSLTQQALLDHCRAHLTGYKRPRSIEFRDELPKTNVGKILRRQLRDEKRDEKSDDQKNETRNQARR